MWVYHAFVLCYSASQLPNDLIEINWKCKMLVKENLTSNNAWSAREILEFLEVYLMQTIDDTENGSRWIDFAKELAKRGVYHNNKQCRQKVTS